MRSLRFILQIILLLAFAAPSARPQSAYRSLNTPKDSNVSNQIEAVITRQSNTSGYGGMTVYIYIPYILYKDGTIYRDLNTSPYDPEIKKSRASEPKKWGRWQYRGKDLLVQWDDKNQPEVWRAGQWLPAAPAKKSDRLAGYFNSRTMAGNGSIAGISVREFTFTPDGHFRTGGGNSVINGTFSRSSSTRVLTGTYSLDGYSIEFRFDNGRVERKGFYYKTATWIGIGNGLFMKD